MLTGRRYLLAFTTEQITYAEQVAGACRAVWNVALEQRREYRRRGAAIGYVEQARQMAEAKRDPSCLWLSEIPAHTLQQVLRDLDRACIKHGTWKVNWRSKARTAPSFRFPDSERISIKRLSRRWGAVKLPKFGWVRFRWTRALGGALRNATVSCDAGRWHIAFCIEDGIAEVAPNGHAPVGVDRGVTVALAISDGKLLDRQFRSPGEAERVKRLQQQLCRRRSQRSTRRKATKANLGVLHARIRARRDNFAADTACRLTRVHGLVVIEDLKIRDMTKSARGTIDAPGRNIRQKAGLNRAILDKGWGGFLRRLEHKARYHGAQIVKVNPAYTSQRCADCGHTAAENRESQAVFRCRSCGQLANADVNAACNILAAGLAVTGRGDLAVGRSVKRQPPDAVAA